MNLIDKNIEAITNLCDNLRVKEFCLFGTIYPYSEL